MVLLLLVRVSLATCPTLVSGADLAVRLEEAEYAFGANRVPAGTEGARQALQMLPCLGEEIPAPQAARVLRVQGWTRLQEGDEAGALGFLAASRAVDPSWAPADTHPWAETWRRARPGSGSRSPVPPSPCRTRIDGVHDPTWPSDRPYLVQSFSPEGAVLLTRLMEPGHAPPPCYARAPDTAPPPLGVVTARAPERGDAVRSRHGSWGLLAGAALSGGASGILYAQAVEARRVVDSSAELSTREAALDRNTACLYGTLGTAGLGVGLLLGSLVAWQW